MHGLRPSSMVLNLPLVGMFWGCVDGYFMEKPNHGGTELVERQLTEEDRSSCMVQSPVYETAA